MGKVKILDEALINKIAAGEVIERPASLVKELLENSLDAGADNIKIEIENAGKKKIKVVDNGAGMSEEDAMMCFERHSTSKISVEDDLFNISSLGFRGEALASIVAVSNTKIMTKTKDSDAGFLVEIEAGKVLKKEKIGIADGTTIEVNDIFFNVPARKKYMKNDDVELNHIINIITRYALYRKDVAIKLIHNGKELINSPKTDSLLDNIAYIYGAEAAKDLIEVDYDNEDVKVNGFISRPNLTRADKTEQTLYVNSRFVKDEMISSTIYDAYHTLLFINRHPVFVLNVELPATDIDVNVHPSKTVIKIKDEGKVEKEIFNAVREAFAKSSLIRDVSLDEEASHVPIKKYAFTKDKQVTLNVGESIKEDTGVKRTHGPGMAAEPDRKISEEKSIGPFKVIGQINRTYIIAENPNGLAVIDQHAAEERVNYEKFMQEKKDKAIVKQKLMKPKIMELSPLQYQMTLNNKEFLEGLGFEFEDFGNSSIKLVSIPEIFGRLKSTVFIDVLNELGKSKVPLLDTEIEERIIRMACRASVKAGEELTLPQMEKLLDSLEKTSNPYSCPHGRPTIINMSISDLEKKFKRIGW